jgi:tetratricopeptide (TPR) repeat protein
MKNRAKLSTTDFTRRGRAAIAAFAALLILALPGKARSDEFDEFIHAKNAFDAGEYAEAVARFDQLLASGLSNPALVIECHKLMGISYLFIGNREKAEHHFTELLTLSPNHSLDPMIFPIEVVDFFLEIKGKNKERLAALHQARIEEKKRKKAIDEAKHKAELEKLRRNVYLEKNRRENSLLVAVMPFGAGQFQNGDTIKGALFLGGELLLSAGAVTTYVLHETLRPQSKEPFSSTKQREDYSRLEMIYRISNRASLAGLAVLIIGGVVDSLYNYEPEVIEWKNVKEKDVPENLRPGAPRTKVSLVPNLNDNAVGISLEGRF